MKREPARISLLDRKSDYEDEFRTAVSLHCHTHHSRENLGFVPQYASRIPVVATFFNRENDRYFRSRGKAIDFTRGYWTPPMTVQRVLESETDGIKRQLGLKPIVSLTDHDDISTAKMLRAIDPSPNIPISLEWTVPFDGGMVHLGVHNLPSEFSSNIVEELALYTLQPRDGRIVELLTWLNEHPDTMVVLNHPLSDLKPLGIERLKALVLDFLNRHKKGIHALEINGYRSWNENRETVALAEQFRLPVVSGGDRHGCAANAVLNLTKAGTFSEFISEIRNDKISEILVMPEYRKPLVARKIDSLADFLRYYPEYPHGHRRWTDRVFFQLEDGVVRPLSYYWHRTVPIWVKSAMWTLSLVGSRYLHPAVRMAFVKKMQSWRFTLHEKEKSTSTGFRS